MPLIDLKIQHGQSFDSARGRLETAVGDVQKKFGAVVRTVAWSPARDSVSLQGPGIKLDIRVDPTEVHVQGDLPLIASLMGGSGGVRKMIESAFKPSAKL